MLCCSTFLPSLMSVSSPQGASSVGRLSPGAHLLRHSSLWSISSPTKVCILNFIYDNKIEVNIVELSLLSNFNKLEGFANEQLAAFDSKLKLKNTGRPLLTRLNSPGKLPSNPPK
ncbi:unnamed protein product [Lactuca virosa]|uniref:Uncharacterized protein n=1 Tax=Lactuca virosa TaxID=75947 RepID=A0AAU9LJF0_9ASTR|nr:unnamed protein product [Lactuca virosa]